MSKGQESQYINLAPNAEAELVIHAAQEKEILRLGDHDSLDDGSTVVASTATVNGGDHSIESATTLVDGLSVAESALENFPSTTREAHFDDTTFHFADAVAQSALTEIRPLTMAKGGRRSLQPLDGEAFANEMRTVQSLWQQRTEARTRQEKELLDWTIDCWGSNHGAMVYDEVQKALIKRCLEISAEGQEFPEDMWKEWAGIMDDVMAAAAGGDDEYRTLIKSMFPPGARGTVVADLGDADHAERSARS